MSLDKTCGYGAPPYLGKGKEYSQLSRCKAPARHVLILDRLKVRFLCEKHKATYDDYYVNDKLWVCPTLVNQENVRKGFQSNTHYIKNYINLAVAAESKR